MKRSGPRQQRLAGITAGEPRAFARLHKSLGPALCGQLERLRDDFVAIGQPSSDACQLAADEWRDAQAARLRRYLRGSGPNAGRVTP